MQTRANRVANERHASPRYASHINSFNSHFWRQTSEPLPKMFAINKIVLICVFVCVLIATIECRGFYRPFYGGYGYRPFYRPYGYGAPYGHYGYGPRPFYGGYGGYPRPYGFYG